MSERVILHSDLNSFYASVETMLDPSLRGKAVAVCGSTESRHGIVLAKSEKAKKAGVKTGMANWEAVQCCPGLIMLHPQYEQYLKYSRKTREIYLRYTDQVEPYGMDECWLDVTGSGVYGGGMEIAEEIRRTVREELGLTVSIGVSFNKIFAKLGSDMKKPDAITCIGRDEFKRKIWPLPASELLYVGRSTTARLRSRGILTIGDIARATPDFLGRLLGKNGLDLWVCANGEDRSRVMANGWRSPVKSVGHGITCTEDLHCEDEIWPVLLDLAQDVGHRLRVHQLTATAVQLTVKDNTLACRQYQAPLLLPTQSPLLLANRARELFCGNYDWQKPVRALTVRAIRLAPQDTPRQANLYSSIEKTERRERIDDAVEDIRRRFGDGAIKPAAIMGEHKMHSIGEDKVTMPGLMYR